jgi:2-methylcitrate dehydratase PrpD
MGKVTDAFLDFALGTTYDSIPPIVLHEAKRIILDGIGNALGGLASDKGKIGIEMAHRMGGTPESTLIGVGGKISAPVAAFCNAELLNGLDMDPIPHIPPIVLPSILAVAEAEKVSGKKLLTALAVGHEIACRLSRVLLSIMSASLIKYNKSPDVFGNSNEHIIGAAVGNALLMNLDREKAAHTIGISAYFCSLPVCRDWESTIPKSMIKYVPVSWVSQGAVQAAMLAREGYTGNAYTLDSEYGFPYIYCREEGVWDPEKVTNRIGEEWMLLNIQYKPYPCCRYLHSSLDAFYRLKDKYDLQPGDIDAVRCYTSKFVANPDQYTICNQIDAQFSGPYNIALAAFGYAPGPAWQDKKTMSDPHVLDFMKKVTFEVAPEYGEYRAKDPHTWYSRVEADVKGKTLVDTTIYPRGANVDGYRLTDYDMKERFRTCAAVILPDQKIEKAIDLIMNIEKLDNLDELMSNITL